MSPLLHRHYYLLFANDVNREIYMIQFMIYVLYSLKSTEVHQKLQQHSAI